MLTRNGICYNLEASPYEFDTGELLLFFSSEFYRSKFKEDYKNNREDMFKILSKRYNLNVRFTLLADLYLYTRIEKRGFHVISEGVIYKCKDNLKLLGGNISNNY